MAAFDLATDALAAGKLAKLMNWLRSPMRPEQPKPGIAAKSVKAGATGGGAAPFTRYAVDSAGDPTVRVRNAKRDLRSVRARC